MWLTKLNGSTVEEQLSSLVINGSESEKESKTEIDKTSKETTALLSTQIQVENSWQGFEGESRLSIGSLARKFHNAIIGCRAKQELVTEIANNSNSESVILDKWTKVDMKCKFCCLH